MRVRRIADAAAGSLMERLAEAARRELGPDVGVEGGEGGLVLIGRGLRLRHMTEPDVRDLAITVARS